MKSNRENQLLRQRLGAGSMQAGPAQPPSTSLPFPSQPTLLQSTSGQGRTPVPHRLAKTHSLGSRSCIHLRFKTSFKKDLRQILASLQTRGSARWALPPGKGWQGQPQGQTARGRKMNPPCRDYSSTAPSCSPTAAQHTLGLLGKDLPFPHEFPTWSPVGMLHEHLPHQLMGQGG